MARKLAADQRGVSRTVSPQGPVMVMRALARQMPSRYLSHAQCASPVPKQPLRQRFLAMLLSALPTVHKLHQYAHAGGAGPGSLPLVRFL
jgi:hypothetical protein